MRRITQITLAATTFLFALALATPAEAHGRRDPQRHRVEHRHQRQHKQHKQFDRHDHRANRHDRSFRHDRSGKHHGFDIPHRIHDDRRRAYRPYYERSVYFAPHHHRHAVYRFPVRVGHGSGFREHFYCNDELFLDHGRLDYRGRRFSISLGF